MKIHTLPRNIFQTILLSLVLVQTLQGSTTIHAQGTLRDPQSSLERVEWGHKTASDLRSADFVARLVASGQRIEFKTQNGKILNGVEPLNKDIPHLVLYRNGVLTDPLERTLDLEIDLPSHLPAGMWLTLRVETQHEDPDIENDGRIVVYQAAWQLDPTHSSLSVRHTFTESFAAESATIPTPTDYYRLEINILDGQGLHTQAVSMLSEDFAFLLENQEIVTLPAVVEEAPGVAPAELVVYYCDMFTYQHREDKDTRLPRKDVPAFIRNELVPNMVEAFRIQTNDWDFPWHSAWRSWRPEDGRRLSVALSTGSDWFHGRASAAANSRITLRTTGPELEPYDSLAQGLTSLFHHELFHNLQRNLNMKHGGSGSIAGNGSAWLYYTEGTAAMAATVGLPDTAFSMFAGEREYFTHANLFLTGDPFYESGLNASIRKLNPYRAAIYWRFLYERCGGMSGNLENPAEGMRIVRNTLESLYSSRNPEMLHSPDLVRDLPDILQTAFKNTTCSFKDHAGSLEAFSRSVYALRLAGGRCIRPGLPQGCGFYDPQGHYSDPLTHQATYHGEPLRLANASQPAPVGIPNSYGMDFVEITLSPGTDSQPLTIEFNADPGGKASFSVQVWMLKDNPYGARPQSYSGSPTQPDLEARVGDGDSLVVVLPAIQLDAFDRLGFAITRLDALESIDPAGEYSLVLHSHAGYR